MIIIHTVHLYLSFRSVPFRYIYIYTRAEIFSIYFKPFLTFRSVGDDTESIYINFFHPFLSVPLVFNSVPINNRTVYWT